MVVQGFGNVGYHSVKFLYEAGAKIIGIAEYEGGIYDENGIDIEAAFQHRKSTGSILNFGNARNVENSLEMLEYECDILVPAALENQITEKNAPNIKAKIIGEGANGPVTSAAADILLEKGVMILPDLYLNAGGVTVSYFEWLKNLSRVSLGKIEKRYTSSSYERLVSAIEDVSDKKIPQTDRENIVRGANEIDLVNSGLEETMVVAYHEIRATMKKHNLKSHRKAAFINALNKIAISYIDLGIFP